MCHLLTIDVSVIIIYHLAVMLTVDDECFSVKDSRKKSSSITSKPSVVSAQDKPVNIVGKDESSVRKDTGRYRLLLVM